MSTIRLLSGRSIKHANPAVSTNKNRLHVTDNIGLHESEIVLLAKRKPFFSSTPPTSKEIHFPPHSFLLIDQLFVNFLTSLSLIV